MIAKNNALGRGLLENDETMTSFKMSTLHPDDVKKRISKLIAKGNKPTSTVMHHDRTHFEGNFQGNHFAPFKKLRSTQQELSSPGEGKGSPFPKSIRTSPSY